MSHVTIEQAMSAKKKLATMLEDLPELSGLGIAMVDDAFVLKVNLIRLTDRRIPEEVDGIPVTIEVVGEVTPL